MLSPYYTLLKQAHHSLAWTLVYVGVLFVGIAFYISVIQRRDVTRLFRRTLYVLMGAVALQGVLGVALYVGVGVRPAGEAHWIYGLGTFLALPFFAYIETTAEKRPSMGSYVWGLAMLVAVGFRSILTGS